MAGKKFYCQIDITMHASTDSAYICLACSRFVCNDCFQELEEVKMPLCPHCSSELIPYTTKSFFVEIRDKFRRFVVGLRSLLQRRKSPVFFSEDLETKTEEVLGIKVVKSKQLLLERYQAFQNDFIKRIPGLNSVIILTTALINFDTDIKFKDLGFNELSELSVSYKEKLGINVLTQQVGSIKNILYDISTDLPGNQHLKQSYLKSKKQTIIAMSEDLLSNIKSQKFSDKKTQLASKLLKTVAGLNIPFIVYVGQKQE